MQSAGVKFYVPNIAARKMTNIKFNAQSVIPDFVEIHSIVWHAYLFMAHLTKLSPAQCASHVKIIHE